MNKSAISLYLVTSSVALNRFCSRLTELNWSFRGWRDSSIYPLCNLIFFSSSNDSQVCNILQNDLKCFFNRGRMPKTRALFHVTSLNNFYFCSFYACSNYGRSTVQSPPFSLQEGGGGGEIAQ